VDVFFDEILEPVMEVVQEQALKEADTSVET
jgi:hypothetical protein